METAPLKSFATWARTELIREVAARIAVVLSPASPQRVEQPKAVAALEVAITAAGGGDKGRGVVADRVAYTWFNRIIALRFMDANGYTGIGVVSPQAGVEVGQPEILAEAKRASVDPEVVDQKIREIVTGLLNGTRRSDDPQSEAYSLLLVQYCRHWNRSMPFMFERQGDFTELLMPANLLADDSVLNRAVQVLTKEVCQDVEVIGWLYQFYISEKKDAVFEGLKKNQKVTPENIPAATQLFTPHWIVRYLVDNSLGRLWLLNRPRSRLAEKMEYYIPPEQPETDFLKIGSPEEIKVCDPACGSGHMLTYAFDLLYAIYEEENYDQAEIPEKILTHNLFGIELDERAGELAAFALTMKARAKQRRFFNKGIKPNICVLEKVAFDREELDEYMSAVGRDLFTHGLRDTLQQFSEADNFGSLIVPKVASVSDVLAALDGKDMGGNLFLSDTHQRVLKVLRMADYLSPRYAVVLANPPYMGGKGMNGRLSAWAKESYPDSKSDLFAMFIERNLDLAVRGGTVAMITMQSWMFLSSFEALRTRILNQRTILSMAHLGARAFDSIGGEVVSTTAFVLENAQKPHYRGAYMRLVDGNSEAEKMAMLTKAVAQGRST